MAEPGSSSRATSLGPLVHAYVRERRARRELAAVTAENTLSTLLGFAEVVGRRPVHRLSQRDVERWLESRSHLAPSSRRNQFSKVQCFTKWLHRRGHTARNVADDVTRPRQPRSVPRALPPYAIAQLQRALPDARARVLFWLGYGMGLRCIEMERLELADWDRSAGLVVVRGKGSHQRVVPVEPVQALWAFDAYLDEHPAAGGPFVRSYNAPHDALTAQAISRMGAEWMWAAGVKRRRNDGVSWHALRHTAATELLDACGDLRVVQEFLGHQHLSSTSVYLARAGVGRMRDAMRSRRYSAGAATAGSRAGPAPVVVDLAGVGDDLDGRRRIPAGAHPAADDLEHRRQGDAVPDAPRVPARGGLG